MLFMYVFGLLAIRVRKPFVLALTAAALCFVTGLAFGNEFSRAGAAALVYAVLGLGWFSILEKTSETIFLWFLVFLPGPLLMALGVGIADVAMFGQQAAAAPSGAERQRWSTDSAR